MSDGGNCISCVSFESFWSLYPRKVAKKDAMKAWAKLRREEMASAIENLPSHIRWWTQRDTEKHFIPHPATWLNGLRFEDELDFTESVPKAAVAWWATDDGVMAKGRELGVNPRGGETMAQYKTRVVEAARKAA